MYNFFASRVNKKAFVQALKEVEKEGYYVSQDLSEDMVFTTNMSRAVAALSDDQIQIKPVKDKPLDVSGYAPNLDTETERVKPASTDVLDDKVFTKQSRAQMYEKMFADDSLLNGEHVKEWGVLSDETSGDSELPRKKNISTQQSVNNDEKLKQNTKKLLAEINQKLAEEKAQKAATKAVEQKEVQPVEAAAQSVEEIKEEKQEEQPKILVEVVAKDEPKEEPKPAPVVIPVAMPISRPAAKPASKPKNTPKPASQRTRKKRRRYDADIAGGFDF